MNIREQIQLDLRRIEDALEETRKVLESPVVKGDSNFWKKVTSIEDGLLDSAMYLESVLDDMME